MEENEIVDTELEESFLFKILIWNYKASILKDW